jgi:hypothetical protein
MSDEEADVQTDGGSGTAPEVNQVRRLAFPEGDELGKVTAVFEDLQHVLRCCEHLVVTAGAPPAGPARVDADSALIEALWTSALISYARCFSLQTQVLSRRDLDELELPGEVGGFHDALLRLRDHYTSQHVNPRETISIGAAEADGSAVGVAVVSAPQPSVDDTTVRQLGRIAYGLSDLLDARMREIQDRVLGCARALDPDEFAALPLIQLDV